MELIIERVVASCLVVVGFSYGIQNKVWRDLVKELLKQPTWIMLWSILFLPLGLIVIMGHNLWVTNWPVIITILGWLVTLKCVLYLLFPQWANFVLTWSDQFLESYIRVSGIVLTLIGCVLTFLTILTL
ncbi:hypothetical protein VB715_02875 [Crocosphaera sp. UHCC 0190]|uniref:hypothetical protein n=1 Tax=Crocosphaera sp. UHCC 0190 TaxID=3110246 RepID=UPI002B1ED3EF|nr:hypothetical protein [Crocosphaera sp. UHCC 0190]MEA5508700.1 hypothetical protein [Crocosphaera sp. UHCC 0190]